MFEFFENVGNFFVSIWNFLTSLITGLVTFLGLLVQLPSLLTSAIGFLPAIMVVFATAIVTILIVKVVVGR